MVVAIEKRLIQESLQCSYYDKFAKTFNIEKGIIGNRSFFFFFSFWFIVQLSEKSKTARYNQPSRVNQSLSIIPFFRAHTQYKLQRLVFSMCHFASFQSLPRGWAEEQLLPIWETWFDPLLHFMRSTSTQMSINTICVWKWKRGPWRFETKKFLYSIWRRENIAFFCLHSAFHFIRLQLHK